MGDRWYWNEKCPNCGTIIKICYHPSANIEDVKCSFCKKEYDIIMDFKLREKKNGSKDLG